MDPARNDILTRLESAIGYRFGDRRLLEEALTHRSFLNESRTPRVRDNERLEFFGDAALSFCVSEILMERFPVSREGELTRLRASLVTEQSLAILAEKIGIGACLRLGRGEEKSGGREKRSILADAYEALLAAVCLDGGIEELRSLVRRHFLPLVTDAATTVMDQDCKTAFQELVQSLRGVTPRYRLTGETGPDHERVFVVEALVDDEVAGEGRGRSKKEAEQAAARSALARLRGNSDPTGP